MTPCRLGVLYRERFAPREIRKTEKPPEKGGSLYEYMTGGGKNA